MSEFTAKTLQPQMALLRGHAGEASIEVLLKSFTFENELVQTAIRLNFISLPSVRLLDLVGNTYDFPVNPADGYIDGSVYIYHVHHPVDVTSLAFHRARGGTANVVIKGTYLFEENGLANCPNSSFTFGTSIVQCSVV